MDVRDTNWTTVSGPGAAWLGSVLRTLDDVVLVTNATVPGVRRLESCAELLGRDALGVVVGPTAKRWPRPVKVAAAGIPVAWILALSIGALLTVPLALVLFITTLATPAVAADTCTPPASVVGLPQPGSLRQASLHNPLTMIRPACRRSTRRPQTGRGCPGRCSPG